MAETLPEGTDHIIPGATSTTTAEHAEADDVATGTATGTRERIRAGASDFREKFTAQTDEYRAQATDKARDFASQGKEKASGALDEVARLIGDNATQIDDKIGSQYGDYARRAADAVASAADQLRDKDVDELVEDARTVIRKSPALALGAAAAAGFFLARILKSGSETLAESAKTVEPVATKKSGKPKKSAAKSSSDS